MSTMRGAMAVSVSALLLSCAILSRSAGAAPAIRTNAANQVPACVSPERLMAFVVERNPTIDRRFADIARWYKYFGEAWRVRWDYAFFQMALETNFLKYRRADGRRGDVNEKQNNFAGIGATGGGVAGDHFPDVKTGVHAQIQHLVAYSGERLAAPIAPRTQLKQDDIVEQSRRLGRAVTFGDLARRWAADKRYAKSIDFLADQYRADYCATAAALPAPIGREAVTVPKPVPARAWSLPEGRRSFAPPSGLGGPKPLMLAGPDAAPAPAPAGELPWLAVQQPNTEPAHPHKTEPSTAPSVPLSRENGAVRTIWSRGDAPGERSSQQATPRKAKPATLQATSMPSDASARRATVETSPHDDDTPLLPTFKIAPVTVQPSRLGGPLPSQNAISDDNRSPPTRNDTCRVLTASYGGKKTLLVRANVDGETRYTALTVLDGFEKSMFAAYAKAEGHSAEIVGEYPSKDEALADAHANCTGG